MIGWILSDSDSDSDSPMLISFGRFISNWFRSLMRLVEIEFRLVLFRVAMRKFEFSRKFGMRN